MITDAQIEQYNEAIEEAAEIFEKIGPDLDGYSEGSIIAAMGLLLAFIAKDDKSPKKSLHLSIAVVQAVAEDTLAGSERLQ